MSGEMISHTRASGMSTRTDDAGDFGALVHMGDALRRTGFLPSHIKDGVSFAAIVLMGRELGMGTMAACRKLQVIKGTVTERADSQLARFKSAGGRSQFKELSEQRAVVWLRHPNGDEHTETFTMDDAKRAGLASNDNYSKHPKAMLRSRAITAGLKSIGWEGAVGLYDPDEIADDSEHREPVVIRPKFHEPEIRTTPDDVAEVKTGRIVVNPKREPQDTRSVADKARLVIGTADSVEKLIDARAKLDKRLAEGAITEDEHRELVAMTLERAEILSLKEDDGTEHFDAAEVDAEARS